MAAGIGRSGPSWLTMWPVTWPTEANENTRVACGTESAITVGGSKLCTGPKFWTAASNIVADQNFSVVLNLGTLSHAPDSPGVATQDSVIGCPKAGRRTLDDPSASDDRSSYSTNFRPKTVRSDQSDLISGRRLTAAKNCLWKRTFRNLNNVMHKIWFCDYRWLLLYKDFRYENQLWVKWLKTFVESAEYSMALQQISIDEYFRGFLSNQVILAKVYLCGFDHLNTLHTHTLPVRMFYFITDGYQNSIFCNITSIPSRDYEKWHGILEQQNVIKEN